MRKILKGLISVSVIAISAPGYAQQVPGTADETAVSEGTGDILVTARRRDESVQDVPLVVNAVTGDTIDKLNLRRFEDITSIVPGYTVNPTRTSAGIVSTMRGVAFNSGASGANTTVEYYFNDAIAFGGTITTALFDVAQIEVLRGPQGTLRGRATPSGSVNITTRAPDLSEVGMQMNATVNDIGGWNLNGAFNIPIVADKLGVRLAGIVAEDDLDRVRVPGGSVDPYSKSRGLRVSAKADPFDGLLLLDFKYTSLYRDQAGFENVESVNQVVSDAAASPITIRARDRLALDGFPNTQHLKYDVFNWQAQLNLFGQKLTYVGAKTKGYFRQTDPQDDANVLANDSAGSVQFVGSTQTNTNVSSHELRLQNDERVAGIFDYVVGGLLYKTGALTPITRADGIAVLVAGRPTLATVAVSGQFVDGPSDEKSVFGNLTAHIGDSTEISGGLRRIFYKTGADVYLGSGPIGTPVLHSAVDENHTIYSGSIKHNFTQDLMVYGSVGTSWRSSFPIIGGPNLPSALQSDYLLSKPETSTSYELGFKSFWLDRRLRLNVTGYYQKFKNYPYRSPSPIFAIDRQRNQVRGFNYVASVPVTVKGIEAEIGFDPTPNFSFSGVVSYADGKIKNGTIPCLDLNRDRVPDVVSAAPSLAELNAVVGANNISSCSVTQAANTTPKWTGSLTGEYRHPVSNGLDGYLRGLLTWAGHSAGDPANAFDSVGSYGLLNLYLGIRDHDDAWEVSFYGKNITNTFRVLTRSNGPLSTVFTQTPAVPASIGTQTFTNYFGITTTPPREFGINLRVSIGSR